MNPAGTHTVGGHSDPIRPGFCGRGLKALLQGLAVMLLLTACGRSSTPHEWQLPPEFPAPVVPLDNPLSVEKIELGRYLFYDLRLSGNGSQACASCHTQDKAFAAPSQPVVGSTGELVRRDALALVNVAYNTTFTWAHPELRTLERQLLIPMFGEVPVELGISGNEATVLARLREDARYEDMFAAAFPAARDPLTLDNIVKALASFVRSIVSFESPFDRYAYYGEDAALSAQALHGLELFMAERFECHHCHGGFNFTQSTTHAATTLVENPFHNIGLYNLDGRGGYPVSDRGAIELTAVAVDMGRFRAPSLRNVAVTAPYMHDGSLASLDAVLDHYSAGGTGAGRNNPHKSPFVKGFEMSADERAALLAFLASLTDISVLTAQQFSDPFSDPAGSGSRGAAEGLSHE